KINSTSVEKYPVIFFIQGGGFSVGTSMFIYSSEVLSTYNDVVVVTFNYRLQALGYLSTQDDVAPGNWGMWDQVAALKWVKQNIEYFNGDPDAITAYGQSAGAVSVGLHMLSPQSKGLFNQAITQSGSAHVNWAVKLPPYDPMDSTIELATKMDCPTGTSTEIIDCLRTKNAFDIVANAFTIMDYDQLGFMVVVDGPGNFLPDDPFSLMERGEYQKMPYMSGYTKSELAVSAMAGIEDPNSGITRQEFREKIMKLVTAKKYDSCSDVIHEDIARSMEFYYLPWEAPRDKIRLRDQYIKLESDADFVAGVHYSALGMLNDEDNPKYIYRFDYESESARYDDYVEVPHLEDLFYCFGRPHKRPLVDILPVPGFVKILERRWTDTDRVMADVSMALWTNFAKYGNPTPEGHSIPGINGTWDKYKAGSKGVFHINEQSAMNYDFDFHDVGYWYDYGAKVVESASNQCCDCQADQKAQE
ncbi:cholinesterase-like, partial [Saccoglossus kowalevskii]|uniref:Neuroligin-2-like n=1 Tax=Saccoglossus kowalevskii TaxID=10224 RepID=A0ABM0M5R1_SACKO